MEDSIFPKTLLIIGAGSEQVPAYEIAKRRGLTVVASDFSEVAPGVKYADHFLKVSTRDAEATKEAALAFHSQHPIHGVMTIANDVPLTVAKVAEALGLRAISVSAAQAASHKLVMKNLFL
ncbi:MAG: phosphoribosylglycinamide synthetase, partial [Deltaproteobacteria bacterium]